MNSRPKILVVSYNIPKPDKSSGELRFVSILEMLYEYWDIDLCIADFLIESNKSEELTPYIEKLRKTGIHVLPIVKDAFSKAIEAHRYVGGYFNLYWIAERMMPLFKIAQPDAFTIVDSVDVHYSREETQAKLGTVEMSKVLQTKKRELDVYRSADVTIAVSKDDLHLLTVKEGLGSVFLIPNIVREYPRVEGKRLPVVIFIGSYEWYPNPEAVIWFAGLIWPIIYASNSRAEFLIIGSNPTPEILALADVPGIKVLGYVPETKPYLDMAAVSVAPLRVGGGMKGKVNEAMGHGIPVVTTKIGAQGFEAIHGKQIMIADDPAEFAACVLALLEDQELQREIGLAGQQLNSAICSHPVVKEKIKELVKYCSGLVPQEASRPFMNLFISCSAKLTQFIKDIGYALQLLFREGIYSFLRRSRLYLKGQRFPSEPFASEQEALTTYNLVKPEEVLKFPRLGKIPLVSIIIPVYNQWDYTYSCLASILKNSEKISYEVIVIDDCSTDDTRIIERFVRNIKVVRNENNLGFLFNCNNASKSAKGKYIAFLNNDTVVQPEWLDWFVKTMEEKPDVGLVGAKLIFSTGKLQEAGSVVFNDGSAMNYGRGDDPDKPQYNYFKDVDYCSGAAICVRKEIWDALDGFDPQFAPAYYEDTDLAMRIRSLGYRIVYQPKSIVIHFEGASHGTDLTQGIKRKQEENKNIFYNKWKKLLAASNFAPYENIFKSRDRAKNKRIVLLFSYSVSDSSNSDIIANLMQIIDRLLEQSFIVKLIPDDFLKTEPGASELEQKGVEILYGTMYKENWLSWVTENANNIDSIHFIDSILSDKYLPALKSILNHDFNFVINS